MGMARVQSLVLFVVLIIFCLGGPRGVFQAQSQEGQGQSSYSPDYIPNTIDEAVEW
jgi:hypothetical protein